MTAARIKRLKRKLQESRYRLLVRHGDFAFPLRDMIFVAIKDIYRMTTNGACIYFDPDWLSKLNNTAIDFMILHQLWHISLEHIQREKYYRGDRFHLACDIVANAKNVEMGYDYAKLSGIGNIFTQTFFPLFDGLEVDAYEAFEGIPFDPANMTQGQRRTYMIDSDIMWDKKSDRGEIGVIVLSPKDETPDDLYYEYPAAINKIESSYGVKERHWVEIIKCTMGNDECESAQGWEKTVKNELKQLKCMEETKAFGDKEAFDERLWMSFGNAKIDWRSMLNCFLQAEVCDYSFNPPDRRLVDSEYFLPDYNVTSMKPKEVLFMVDTSGSVDNDTLSMVYSEIAHALAQFNGLLIGRIGFFNVKVLHTKRFGSISELKKIVPVGGGGTCFKCIFDYVNKEYNEEKPASIVIFTDGEGEYPKASVAENIPVLWVLGKDGKRAPWGQTAFFDK